MLTSSAMPSTSISSSRVPSPANDAFDENPHRLTTYLHQLAGCYETEVNILAKDHCYARPWNWKPENVYVKPIKKLFFPKSASLTEKLAQDEEVNIEAESDESLVPPIDFTRARHQIDELQRLATFARPDENEDWEEQLDKILWTPVQNRIFTKVLKIFSSERLTRLAKANSPVEPIYRRTSVDTAARRFRETLASAGWDWRLAQWLHNLLFDHLPQEYLGIYLDILQTLRLKVPQLIDKMIAVQPNINAKTGSITWETLGSLLKRTWDPVTPSLNSNRLKKLPGNPILIIVPSGVGSNISSRQHKWISQLGALGMVVTVHTHLGLAANRMTMMVCIDQLVQATRTKIQDIRSDCPGRPIILVGFNTGAALACQVAQMEHVTAVICLGFPFITVEGKRGAPDDTLMDIRCPVMFVIGQNATLVKPDDLEELREKMLVETSLVVVGTADDNLRISTAKKISEGITQSMVDRCILDEIGDFVGTILLQPHPLPLRPMLLSNYENKNSRKEQRKRRNSTSSSVESEPNSPTVKKSRPSTPISSAVSVGQSTPSTTISRVGTFSTQANLIAVGGTPTNHAQIVKRKPRVINNQKAHFVEHLITSRLAGQSNSNSDNGGITLNIGSLASLAPIGPIRLAPASTSQAVLNTTKNITKPSIASTKVSKIVPSSVQLQNVSKMKAIVSSNKGFSKVMSSNYRHLNVPDKNGDAKLVNVLTTSGNQIRVATTTTAAVHSKPTIVTSNGNLSNILQNGKNSFTLTTSSSSARVSAPSSILLTPSNSVAINATSSTPTISKVMEDMATTSSSSHVVLSSTQSLDTFKMSQLPRQVTTCNNNNNSHNTSCGSVIMVESSLNAKPPCSSVIVPLNSHNSGTTILPLSNKIKVTHKSTKTMPKITVNTSNLQRIHKPQTVQKNSLANDIDDELGNILDIPIIFAKDDDNLNSIEKNPTLSQTTVPLEVYEKGTSKLSSNTKVVLISNKQDKLQQTSNKFVTPSTQAIICPSVAVQNLNHVILQTKSQNPAISKAKTAIPIQNRTNQPTVKYTKIILAKRNSQLTHQNDKNEQVIATKTIDKVNACKLLNLDKNEHRFTQITSKQLPKNDNNFIDETLEIEDAIKMNIIERKHTPVHTPVDLPSQISGNVKECLVEPKSNGNKESNSQCSDDVINLQI